MSNKNWFLITTADERSWKKDSSILFLGEWCRTKGQDDYWKDVITATVPPYGIGDGQRQKDVEYIDALYESLLLELHEKLNDLHGTHYSVRYWRILLGTWLFRYTTMVFNRWQTIKNATDNYEIFDSIVLDIPTTDCIPLDYHDFARLSRVGVWDQFIFGNVIRAQANIPYSVKPLGKLKFSKLEFTREYTPLIYSSILKKIFFLCERMGAKILSQKTDALMVASGLSFLRYCQFCISLGQIPITYRTVPTPKVTVDLSERSLLDYDTEKYTGFEKFVRDLLPLQIPICYVEGYKELCAKSADLVFPEMPKFIFTSNSFDGDELFKVWTAGKVESGIPYIIAQHGACYGTEEYVPSEVHETKTSDRYLTWGWKGSNPKHFPLGAIGLMDNLSSGHNPAGGILLVEKGGAQRLTPWDETTLFEDYLQDQFSFVDNLSLNIKKLLTVRLYSAYLYLKGSEDYIWENKYSGINIDYGNTPMPKLIKNARLVVYSYNSTGILECLASNTPTLFFWNIESWPIRETAEPYFNILMEVGIFHKTPISVANKVNEIWSNVDYWWNNEETQTAIKSFCASHVHLPEYPLSELKKALLSVKSNGLQH
jgi:putative transferase (TIGR04331 family)